MKVTAYLRVSTDKQVEHGYGLDVQRAAIREWAKASGHKVVAVARGRGYLRRERPGDTVRRSRWRSATCRTAPRPGWSCSELDRLARDLIIQETLIAEVRKIGGELFTTAAGEAGYLTDDPDDPSRKLIRQVLGAVNEYERAMIVLRMKAGRRIKASRGGYAGFGSPAFGQRSIDKELVPDEAEQAAARGSSSCATRGCRCGRSSAASTRRASGRSGAAAGRRRRLAACWPGPGGRDGMSWLSGRCPAPDPAAALAAGFGQGDVFDGRALEWKEPASPRWTILSPGTMSHVQSGAWAGPERGDHGTLGRLARPPVLAGRGALRAAAAALGCVRGASLPAWSAAVDDDGVTGDGSASAAWQGRQCPSGASVFPASSVSAGGPAGLRRGELGA